MSDNEWMDPGQRMQREALKLFKSYVAELKAQRQKSTEVTVRQIAAGRVLDLLKDEPLAVARESGCIVEMLQIVARAMNARDAEFGPSLVWENRSPQSKRAQQIAATAISSLVVELAANPGLVELAAKVAEWVPVMNAHEPFVEYEPAAPSPDE